MPPQPRISASRIVVIMPNWLGDAVMATPFLRALRELYPEAHIAGAAIPLVAPVLSGLPFVNETHVHAKKESPAKWLRENRFDLGILLPNSFRSAWNLFRGGLARRLGYARDRRSMLLTDRVMLILCSAEQRAADAKKAEAIRTFGGGNVRVGSAYQPVPTIDYYLELAKYLGAEQPPKHMELGITPEEQREADAAAQELGGIEEGLAVLVPGANFGSSKCWSIGHFAAVAEALADPAGQFRMKVLVATSPVEREIGKSIVAGVTRGRARVCLLAQLHKVAGASLGGLKAVVRQSRLIICNDTGPRHFAAAFGVPAVTLFGPTDPVWAETFSEKETIVRVPVPCGPCQLKQCPIDHRCMTGITVEMVLAAARQALDTA